MTEPQLSPPIEAELPAEPAPALPPPAPLRLHQVYHYLAGQGIESYPPLMGGVPEEMEGVLCDAILGDLATAREATVEATVDEVRAFLQEHPAPPPPVPVDPSAPAPPAVSTAPYRSGAPHIRFPLCSKGCCFECEACAQKPGQPMLCADCIRRREVCAARAQPQEGAPDARLSAARLRVAADLRRIGLGLFELSAAVRDKTRWALRHGIVAVQLQMERRGDAVAQGVTRGLDRGFVDPVVTRIMRLAAKVDGGPAPRSATREAVLVMVYGADRSRWPAWVRHDDI